jgi:hypothetical protein
LTVEIERIRITDASRKVLEGWPFFHTRGHAREMKAQGLRATAIAKALGRSYW